MTYVPYSYDAIDTSRFEKIPNRKGFGEGLLEVGELNQAVVALCADLTESTQMHLFAKKFPERFVEIGVAEQNLVTVASGMAALNMIPFCSSYAMFSPGRNWEQIRTTICYNNVPVTIVGSHAGVSVGPDGGTHQAIEDIALMRILPRMRVVVPLDYLEAKKATKALASHPAPSYLRLAREKTPQITTDETLFELGKGYLLRNDNDSTLAFIGCGPLLSETLIAAQRLAEEGIGSIVVNMHTIKPLDYELLDWVRNKVSHIVTVEEHQKAGGLGSAISEYYSSTRPAHTAFVGIDDLFGQSGTLEELWKYYKLDSHSQYHIAQKLLTHI